MSHNIKPGVATGDDVQKIFDYAKEKGFALPAVNVTSSSTVNAVIETAAKVNSPVIIQFSNGGAHYNAGKGLSNENEKAAIAGAISGAKHIHAMAELYGVPVIVHTDHAAKKLLPWIDGLLAAGEKHFADFGKPLFSSHMLDLSEEPLLLYDDWKEGHTPTDYVVIDRLQGMAYYLLNKNCKVFFD
jgi:fructose-bisphosphate aldolase class II